ncbi:MAG: nuclear transport factor 2 family protein [Dactylosporangium sp.]|nr:nuclear transport factor 2 family protein [Dactylosporangium sp.]
MITPRDVLAMLLSGIDEGRWTELSRLYADDAVVEQPLLAPTPGRIVGREQIDAHFSAAASGPIRLRVRNLVVHDTTDPEVIIAEYDYEATHAVTGRTTTLANIQVLRVRDGKIQASRDYHDHLRLAAVAGRADKLAAAMA